MIWLRFVISFIVHGHRSGLFLRLGIRTLPFEVLREALRTLLDDVSQRLTTRHPTFIIYLACIAWK